MGERFRALLARTPGPNGNSLMHLLAESADTTLCRLFLVAQLTTGTTVEDRVYPACLAELHLRWTTQEAALT